MGLVFTAGFAAITVGHLNIISIAFASLYIGLGVDYAVHLCLYYRESKSQGHSNAEAVNHCLQGVGSSLFLCALTTAIGFFAFIPTDYSGVSELGIISGGGIFIGLFISIIIMPAWFCVFPVNNPKPMRSNTPMALITFPFKYARQIKTVSILLAIGACFVLTQLTFDANPINLRDPKSESVSTIEELLKAKNDSPFAVTALARSLEEAKQTAAKMSHLSSVNSAITLASFVAENQESKLMILDDLNLMLGNSLKSFPVELKDNGKQAQAVLALQLAVSKAIAEQSKNASLADLLKLQQQLNSLMTKANNNDYQQLEKHLLSLLPYTMQRLKNSLSATEFGLDDIPNDLKKHWLSSDGYYRVLITPAKDQNDVHNLREFVAQVQGVDNGVSGLPIANEAGGTAVVNAFLQAFGGAFLAISLLLWWTYHNFKQMALVIGPLLLAALLTGASNVLLSNPFNFANIIALPLLLGLGIDSSILIMHKLHFNKHHDDNLLQSSTTRGIIFSSLTTLFSFSSLVFTTHRGMASMGLLLTLGLFFTVICSLVVLPAFSGKKL
jgi:hopanoid biosynthesis associated RND transporter like protein HpnN